MSTSAVTVSSLRSLMSNSIMGFSVFSGGTVRHDKQVIEGFPDLVSPHLIGIDGGEQGSESELSGRVFGKVVAEVAFHEAEGNHKDDREAVDEKKKDQHDEVKS